MTEIGREDHLRRPPEGSIFSALTTEEWESLLTYAVKKTAKKGQSLFVQGDTGDSMMIVLSGTLKVSVMSPQGKEVVMDYIGRGSIIGEIALLDGDVRTATATAVEPTEFWAIQRRNFVPFMGEHLDVGMKVIQVLCQRIRQTNSLVEDNTALAMGPKLARGILRLIKDHGVEEEEGISLSFKISQGDLGSYVSLSRENVNRQLRDWESQAIIKLKEGRVIVLDEDELEFIAEYF